ncbi:copper resistance system multicopper oxidase [Rhodospirillaceae bacterium KN72]|uniref:Copper resistance system multicopper oxidase n=1 Tax=Pacificispira spongiicola TaxID=2729598 RepID=A0A7Y0HDJ9_9PROT|nr:copper resistance system multicopper oxidase [Pacificispira spongiicola]NMM43911.1 copper resistance system multicopper oxidase [Pacificispira spongiicola]
MKLTRLVPVIVIGIGLLPPMTAVQAETYNLTVDQVTIDTGDFTRTGIGYNGTSPGPVLRFKEGEDVTINVTNNLSSSTSIHWHGLILPFEQDGVPGISYTGIEPGETFTYRFPIVQSGTYWFHSHSGFQEPDGAYGAIVIEPKGREPFRFDREYVVQLTDAHPHSGSRVMRNLKMMPDYYNRQQRTFMDFLSDVDSKGLEPTLSDRADWGDMRMMPTDIEDLQGVTPLINGMGPTANWTGLFEPGERIRLRFINSSAMTYFDIRIPGLQMTIVQSDGNNVQPVKVDEFRIAVAETYDVIVQPKEAKAFTLFAESMSRSAFARGTLAPAEGMTAEVPMLREPPLLTMADMGMAHEGMDHGAMAMDNGAMNHGTMGQSGMPMGEHVMQDGKMMSGMDHNSMGQGMSSTNAHVMPDGSSMEGMDHSAHGGMAVDTADPFYAPGSGLTPTAYNDGKFLSYADLKAQKPLYPDREATREIELRLTGNMERYIWSINGVKYADADPIVLQYGERVRFKFVNETMMAHPMHLHGMWSILDNGNGKFDPVKHVISVAPGTTVYTETEVDAPGQWAFHCHLSYHADSGMFRKVVVEGGPNQQAAASGNDILAGGVQ